MALGRSKVRDVLRNEIKRLAKQIHMRKADIKFLAYLQQQDKKTISELITLRNEYDKGSFFGEKLYHKTADGLKNRVSSEELLQWIESECEDTLMLEDYTDGRETEIPMKLVNPEELRKRFGL